MLAATSALALVCIASFAAAQDVVRVVVGQRPGGNVFTFNPPNVSASPGTTITFVFTGAPGNHSVTQSSFNSPCTPLEGGFDSGNIFIPPNTPTSANFPTWNLTVTADDDTPLWFFCKQLRPQPHCVAGMVGAINAPDSGDDEQTFDAYVANARAYDGTVSQDVGELVGEGASASALPGPFSGSITGFGLPTVLAASTSTATASAPGAACTCTCTCPAQAATSAAAASGTTSASSSESSAASAGSVRAGSWTVVLAALSGIFMV